MNENEVKACANCRPNGLIRFKRVIRDIRERFRKSNMESWAEREIAIACKRERGESGEKGWDYGCACYESAHKAYKSLLKDGHSGFSIGLTQQILNRLIEGKPLTPIEDTPDVWNDIREYHEETLANYCEQDVKVTEEMLRRKAEEDFDHSNSTEEVIKRASCDFLDD